MRIAFIGIRRYFYMLDWLKFFSGSFFVNKFAMQGADRKIGNAVVSFLLGWILLFVGLIIGYSSSFNTHLNNCPSALQTIANVFDDGICVKTENYRALSGKNGSFDNAEVINTFTNENDAKKYSSDGFNFILDTRPLEYTYDDFTLSVTEKNGDKTLSYDDYRELSDNAKNNYSVNVNYTGNALVLSEDLIQNCLSYLERVSDENDVKYDSDIANSYKNLVKDGQFDKNVYELYIKAYYPEIAGKDAYSVAPTVRTWYVENIFKNNNHGQFLAILDDTVVGEFVTDRGVQVSFNGYYFKTDGVIYETSTQGNEFILKAFKGSSALNINIYLINLLKISPLFVLIPVIFALILWIIDKAAKFGVFEKYGKTLKVVSSFVLVASLITFLLTILLSFFLPRGTVFSLLIAIYAAVLFVRTVALAVPRFIGAKLYRIPKEV